MLDPLGPYSVRFGKRFIRDATAWARDNIIWGVVVLVGPPFAIYIRDPHANIDWLLIRTTLLLYGFAFVVYVLGHVIRTPKKLDVERDVRESTLCGDLANRDQALKERDASILTLSEKSKRSKAEQADCETIQRALAVVKDKGKLALRFLRNKGSIGFGLRFGSPVNGPTPPQGLTLNDLIWVYHHCESEGIVTMNRDLGGNSETFTISPHMHKALGEVLFEE
jgi:hypothetical protein